MASYHVVNVSLGAVLDRKEIVPPGFPVSKITVRGMALGASVSLHYGNAGEAIPLITQGERFALCPAERGGIYVSVPTAQAGSLLLLISSTEGEVDSLGVGAPGGGDVRIPTSPIAASIETPGSLNGPAFIHLLNVVGSGRLVRLRKLQLWCSNTQVVKVRRTSSPIDLAGAGGTLKDDTPVRIDERDTRSITAEFRGTTFTVGGASFGRDLSQWQFPIQDQSGNGRFYYLEETDFPETIKEGSAVEISLDANGAGSILRAHAVWDEE